MTVGRTSTGFDPGWFTVSGSGPVKWASLKGECVSRFQEAVKAEEREWKAAFDRYSAEVRRQGTSVRLTDEQLEHLSDAYDPENMTREECRAFVDDLCRYGVLREEDKDCVSYNSLVPATFFTTVQCTTTAAPFQPYTDGFWSSGGNVLDWSRYLSTFERFDPDTRSYQRTPGAILFDRIQQVLVKMGAPDRQ